MRPALELSLGGGWLMLARQGAPRTRLRIEAAGNGVHEALAPQLDQALRQLAETQGPAMQGMALDVSLGQAHAHIGLASLGATTGRLNQKALQECCGAWVAQGLHLDPATQLIRWQALAPLSDTERSGPERSGPERQLLIASVSSATVQAVSDFAARHRLRLRSCRPAVLSVLDRARQSAERLATWVWTEQGVNGLRASAVQLLGLQRGQLTCCWRGWVPAQPDDAAQAPLQGAIRRFQACHFTSEVRHLHWPGQGDEVLK